MDKILITGATGFVGSVLLADLKKSSNVNVISTARKGYKSVYDDSVVVGEINDSTDYSAAIDGVDVVIHCAARVHVMNDTALDPLLIFREVNTYGTLNLAKQAAQAGVKRFIFISSIKVNGESSSIDKPFTAEDVHHPQDPYGISKSEAETQLLALGQETGMEIVIIRPPLVYGPGVKANFSSLLNLASKGLPLPFACFNQNRRSMVSVDNLVDLIITCIDHPKAANQVFLVSDDHDLSTADLISKLTKACGKSGFMLPIPIILFKFLARVIGKQNFMERLTGSLRVDISKTKSLLNWVPPQSVEDGFKVTADAFLKSNKQ
jgi:UDP-glucose 4-epimerase